MRAMDRESRTPDPTPQPTLDLGDGLALRPWRWDDAPAVLAACQDPEIERWAGLPQPFGEEATFAFLDGAMSLWSDGQGASFAMVDAEPGRLLGAITRYGPDGHRSTLGCWVAAPARGRGVGTRAIRAICDWTFAATATERIESFLLVGNAPSERMLVKAGFTREGLLRAWDVGADGRPVDCTAWSRLRGDP